MNIKITILAVATAYSLSAQTPAGTPPIAGTAIPQLGQFSWFTGGNNTLFGPTANNIFGFVSGTNKNIWHQTNGFSRMLMEKGLGTQVDGRIAYGNNLPGTFVPRDRVHLFEAANTGSVQIRFQNTNTGTAATDGYAIGTDNVNRVVNHTQFENREMRWLSPNARNAGAITEWMRIENNKTNIHTGNTPTDGYLGLNNTNPYFHIDGITPSHNGGELFLSFQNTDAGDTRMGLVNAAQINNIMQPTFFGNLDSLQPYTALQTVGSVKGNQDTTPNTQAITRFISGRDWTFNIQGIQNVNEVTFRNLFSWLNGNTIMMHMSAQGRLRIGRNLTTLGAPPRNRVEISANAAVDPYGNKIATNGASGLRLTYLTSAKTPVPKDTNGVDNTKVLSVDSAGNVVLVNAAGTVIGNNGVFVNAAGAAQLGVPCNSSPTVKFNNGFTTDRVIHMRGHNFIFGDGGRVGIGLTMAGVGMSCGVGNKLEIINTVGNPYYAGTGAGSGLRFRYLTSASPTTPNGTNGVNTSKVLTVDVNGDVVLTNVSGGSVLGNICNTITNPLTSDWEIPTNNFNFRFIAPSGTNSWGKNYIGIGTSCAPTANLDILSPVTSNNPNAVTAVNVSQTNLANNSNYSGIGIGIASDINALNKNNAAVIANARNATNNYGVYSTANAINSGSSNQRNVGVYAEASKAPQNFAMRGRAVSNTGIASGLTIGGLV